MTKGFFAVLYCSFFAPFFLSGQTDRATSEQTSSCWYAFAKYGVPFLETQKEPSFSSFETSFRIRPGVHANIGGGYQYLLAKQVSLSMELSYQYGQFSRTEKYTYNRFNGEVRSGTIRDQYRTHSILSPIKLNYHIEKINFSLGIVAAWHLATRVDVKRKFYVDGVFDSSSERTYNDGDYYATPIPFVDVTEVSLDRKLNAQALIGVQYRLNDWLFLDFEVRQNLLKNRLVRKYSQYDVVGDVYEYFEALPRIFSTGLYYVFP